MQFVRNIINVIYGVAVTIWGWLDNIPSIPFLGWDDWVIDRLKDAISFIISPLTWFRTLEAWAAAIHDAIFFILDLTEIDEHLAKVFEIPKWTWDNVLSNIVNSFLYIIAVVEEKRQILFDGLRPAIEGAWSLLTWDSDAWTYMIGLVMGQIFETTSFFWDSFDTYVWGRLTEVLGPLETWLEGQADNLIDNILDLGNWFKDKLLDFANIPDEFVGWIGMKVFHLMQLAGADFINLLLNIVSDVLSAVAEPIVNLGERILIFVWDESGG